MKLSLVTPKPYIWICQALLALKTTDIPKNALSLTDTHCTITVPLCTGYWYVLYITVPHCTFLLTWTVQYWTTLYVSTDLHCTVLDNTVRFDWLVLYSTEPLCTFWLTSTVQHWTTLYRILTHTVHCCTTLNGDTDMHCTLLYSFFSKLIREQNALDLFKFVYGIYFNNFINFR